MPKWKWVPEGGGYETHVTLNDGTPARIVVRQLKRRKFVGTMFYADQHSTEGPSRVQVERELIDTANEVIRQRSLGRMWQ